MDTVSRCEVQTVYAIRIRGGKGREGGEGRGRKGSKWEESEVSHLLIGPMRMNESEEHPN